MTYCTLMNGNQCDGHKYCGENCQCGDVGCPVVECPPNTILEAGCDDSDNICKISCSSGDLCEHNCRNIGSVNFDEMNINRCEKLCEDSRDNEEITEDAQICRFWRWVMFT